MRRKILPALYHRDQAGQIPQGARILGVSRRVMSDADYQAFARKALEAHIPEKERDKGEVDTFLKRLSYVALDATQDKGWHGLAEALKPGEDRIRVFYLATAPDLFGPICEKLGKNGLVTPKSRVVIEKPLGKDLESARAVNDAIGKVFPESRVYRIDPQGKSSLLWTAEQPEVFAIAVDHAHSELSERTEERELLGRHLPGA